MHHAPQAEVRQRARAIRMLHLGNKQETVADLLAVAPSTIWNWHRHYRANRLAGVVNQAKRGHPAKADAPYPSLNSFDF
jgi:transposase